MSPSAPDALKAFIKLKETLSGEAAVPGDEAYEFGIARWSDNAVKQATYVVFPKTNEDVSQAVRFAREHNLELAVCGGGHSGSGSSSTDGGVALHLNKFMNGARCDPEKRLLYVDGGATWEIVDKVGMEHGLATVAGNVNHTGVGGLALGGGYGWLTGRHGMTVDNMVQVTVVLASGEIVTANEKEHPDLFWGCRGAGCNFGVVTEFVFKAHPQRPTVFVAKLIFTIDKLEALVKINEEWSKSCGPDEGLHWACVRVLPGLERGKPAILLTYVYNGDSVEGRRLAQRWYDLGPTKEKALVDLPYVKLNTLQNEANRHGGRRYIKGIKSRSTVSAETIRTVLEAQDEVVQANPGLTHCGLVFEASPKRKAASVPIEATAYAGRGTGAEGIVFSFYSDPSLDETARNNARKWAQLVVDRTSNASATGQETEPIGVSYANLDPDAAKTDASTIFGRNYDRLRKVKRMYDPDNVWHLWHPIKPADVGES